MVGAKYQSGRISSETGAHRKIGASDRKRIDDALGPRSSFLERDEPAKAEPILRQLLELDPRHGGANLALGQWLLDQGKPDGLAFLERVLDDEESEWTRHAGVVLAEHFRSTGATERLKSIRSRLDRYSDELAESQKERSIIRAADRFVAHQLSAAEFDQLLAQLGEIQEPFDAWLVRKDVRHFRKRRLFILCVRTPPNWLGFSSAERDIALVARILKRIQLSGQMLVVSPQGGFKRLARKVMASHGARVCRRQRPTTNDLEDFAPADQSRSARRRVFLRVRDRTEVD